MARPTQAEAEALRGELQTVRLECLAPAKKWVRPTGTEIAIVARCTQMTHGELSAALGLTAKQIVGRWIREENVPYSAWALMCHFAGLGCIWVES